MFHALHTALSSLRAAQVGLEVSSNNLANANTPEFRRQSVQFSDRGAVYKYGRLHRAGVDVDSVRHAYSQALENSYHRNIGDVNQHEAEQMALQKIETIFNDGEGSMHDHMRKFLSSLRELQTRPGDPTLRGIAIEQAELFTRQVRAADEALLQLQAEVSAEIDLAVLTVNELSTEIQNLTGNIRRAEALDAKSGGQIGQRDQRVTELAQFIGPKVDHRTHAVRLADNSLIIGARAPQLVVQQDENSVWVSSDLSDKPLNLQTGRIKGLLSAHNDIIGGYRTRLDEFAAAARELFNSIHSGGVGIEGGFDFLNGAYGASDPNATLADEFGSALTAGDVTITVRDSSTGEPTLHSIAVNPITDSLEDVATQISGIDHLRAFVDPENGRLNIVSEHGFTFEFTGNQEGDIGSLGGTSSAAVGGFWDRPGNEHFSLVVNGSGTVGITDDLAIDIVDQHNNVVQSLHIGPEYEPGSTLEFNGLTLEFSAGTAVDGTVLNLSGIGEPDETGLLNALGLNSFFEGDSAADFRVSHRILDNPSLLALSRSGEAGDGEFLERYIDTAVNADVNGSRGLDEYLVDISAQSGIEKDAVDDILDGLNAESQQIASDRDEMVGVDPNEELVMLLQYQRYFETAARVVSSIDESLEELMTILR